GWRWPERADAGMRDLGILSWLLHPTHELHDIVWWQVRTRGKRRQRGVDKSDRDEILLGVEAKVRVERHAGRQRHLVQQHRVAVRRGARRAARCDHTAGAADVLD